MSELVIRNIDGPSATFIEGEASLDSVLNNRNLLKYSVVSKKDLNRLLNEFNRAKVHNIWVDGDNLECFVGELKITLKDYYYFQGDSRFDFIFDKLKKYKLDKEVKWRAKVLAGVIAISTVASFAAFKANNKDVDTIITPVKPSYDNAIYVDDNKEDLENDYVDTLENEYIKKDITKDEEETDIKTQNLDVKKEQTTMYNMLGIKDETDTTKAEKTKDLYYDIIEKYANMYGLDPSIMLAIATQERGVHSNEVDSGGAIGLMQVQVSVWNGNDIKVYNYETESYETIHITLDKLRDINFNIKVGCAIYQNYLNQMQGNKIAAIQTYNMGPGSVNKIINSYCYATGKTKDEVLKSNDLGWLDYRNSSYPGDPDYVEHVLRYDECIDDINVRSK